MNAINFIQQHGVEKAREVVQLAPDGATHLSNDTRHYVNADFKPLPTHIKEQLPKLIVIEHLKRLVESVDLIGCFDDLEQAKSWLEDLEDDVPYIFKGDTYDNKFYKHELKQAIADYEQLFGNTETLELETLRDCDTSPNCKKFDERVNSND